MQRDGPAKRGARDAPTREADEERARRKGRRGKGGGRGATEGVGGGDMGARRRVRGVAARRATRRAPLPLSRLAKIKTSVQILQIYREFRQGCMLFLECRAAVCQFAAEIDTNFTQVLLVRVRKTHAGFVAGVAGFAASA